MAIGIPEQAAEMIKLRLRRLRPLLIGFLILYIFRLWYLQIYHGSYYKTYSEKYRIRSERVIANRGLILDRNGTVLVENRPYFHLLIVPEDCSDWESLEHNLVQILPNRTQHISEQLSQAQKAFPYLPFTIASDLSFSEVVQIEARSIDIPGVRISYEAKRFYPYGERAGHLIGYMGKITLLEWQVLKNDEHLRFRKHNLIGKSGIEKIFNDQLTGFPRDITFEADAQGRRIEILTPVELRSPIPGHDIYLTLDWELQMFIENIFKEFTGAVVVMNPNDGDILAMVNRPSFDPNLFSVGISVDDWKNLINDQKHPLINRSLQSAYSPGSIFKIITATAGLNKGLISPAKTHNCLGRAKFLGDWRSCWKSGGHGKMNLHRAIVNSCNIYFFNAAIAIGIDNIATTSREFGLGQRTNIQLPHEERGLIPTPEWKERVLHQPWWRGETLSVAIGQGSVLTTPIQLVRMISAIANGGAVLVPRIIKTIGQDQSIQPKMAGKLKLSPEILTFIQASLKGVVNEDGGTARRVQIPDITVAGKTGTTQVVTKEITAKYGREIPHKYRDHNWFVGYAPYEEPQ
ncbi:penicillin-binding protein 2, partial [candidate division CSSED10-310 bacterium]